MNVESDGQPGWDAAHFLLKVREVFTLKHEVGKREAEVLLFMNIWWSHKKYWFLVTGSWVIYIFRLRVLFFLHEYILPTDSCRQAKPHGWRLGLKVQGTGFRCIQWWGCTFKQLNTPRPTHSHIITWNLKKVNALYRAVVCLAVLGHCRNMADSLSVHRRLTLRSQKHNNFYFQAMTH